MLIALAPILIALAGVLLYALASNSKVVEIGRILFFCGMLVTTYLLAGHQTRLW